MNKLSNLEKMIGNTPLIKIKYKYKGNIRYSYFKCEWYNLTGSIKDRVALGIIKSAYAEKKLHCGQTIVETTSGNMGISFSAIGKYLGHKVAIFMPSNMSNERKELIKLYGAELHEYSTFHECFENAKIYASTHNGFLTNQFSNINNLYSHYNSTANEILEKTPTPKCFVAGVGTAGTLMGIGKKLKEISNTKIVALEPKSSLILSSGVSQGSHKLQGLSDDIVPDLYDSSIVDQIISVADNDAICMAQKISSHLGLGVGISGGANFIGTVLLDNDAVSVFPDDNKKYISTDLISNCSSKLVDDIELIDYEVI